MNKDIYNWLENHIYKNVLGEDCIDNLRIAAIDDILQVEAYEHARDRGCCGSYDGEVKAPDGKMYMVGCNYGH